MRKTKLCLGVNKNFPISTEEQIKMFHKVGFEGFFTGPANPEDLVKYRLLADELGLIWQSIHAPFGTIDKMWKEGNEAEETLESLKACVHSCYNNRVPIMVCHAIIGFDKHTPNEIGIRNFEKLVQEAEKCGVKIALENTEGLEYLDALMEHFKGNDTVGFCWDTGHELCYNSGADMMARYGNRLIATHLNDNLGISDEHGVIAPTDDLHLLPFDGIADWKNIVCRLSKYHYNDILTFELKPISKRGPFEHDIYKGMPIQIYIAEAYKRACRVATLMEKTSKDRTFIPNSISAPTLQ